MYGYLKSALYRGRALHAYHRIRNRRTLTAVMFHRVLPPDDSRWPLSDPEWTVSARFFDQCLEFFDEHYNLISTQDLLNLSESTSDLPDRSLVITFDDGWADVSEYGLPALTRRSLPATVFVVAGEVDGLEPWQEVVRRAWRRDQLTAERLPWLKNCKALEAGKNSLPLSEWIDFLSGMAFDERSAFLARLRMELNELTPGQMMSQKQISQMVASGFQIGSHGLTHTSVPLSPKPWEELSGARQKLAALLEKDQDDGPVFFSFPNGQCDSAALEMAATAGYREIFTSEPCLNALPTQTGVPMVLGRINIPAKPLSDENGDLRPELLALWLFSRPIRSSGYPGDVSE